MKPQTYRSGILHHQRLVSRQSSHQTHQLATLLPSHQTQRSASHAAATATSLFGICKTRRWCASSKDTLMAHRVLTSVLTVQSCGLADSTTLWGRGTCEKVVSCSSTISAHRFSHSDIVLQVSSIVKPINPRRVCLWTFSYLHRRLVGSWNGELECWGSSCNKARQISASSSWELRFKSEVCHMW